MRHLQKQLISIKTRTKIGVHLIEERGKKRLLIGEGEGKEDVERERENRVAGEGDGILSLVIEAIYRALSFINAEAE